MGEAPSLHSQQPPSLHHSGYRDRNELGDSGRRRAEGQGLSGIAQTDIWNIIPNILITVEQEAAKNVDS